MRFLVLNISKLNLYTNERVAYFFAYVTYMSIETLVN